MVTTSIATLPANPHRNTSAEVIIALLLCFFKINILNIFNDSEQFAPGG
jgi:hypothetical protein